MRLVEFLKARLDEDEQMARRATAVSPAPWRVDAAAGAVRDVHGAAVSGHWRALAALAGTVAPDHIVRHDPARVLAEVGAKRWLVDRAVHVMAHATNHAEVTAWLHVIQRLASVHADHPDYQQGWCP